MPPAGASFPPLDVLLQGVGSDYERTFLKDEFGPGLDYYVARLDRLALRGEVALDAGCGAGQWSLALAQRFRHVIGLDLKPDRLGVLQRCARATEAYASPIRGSLTDLPLADASVDAVFCYGVIMFTPVARVLAEFQRVLRPGGRLYVCLNGDGWNKFLIEDWGRRDPHVATMGRDTLYNTFWRRARERGFVDETSRRRLAADDPTWKGRARSAARALSWRAKPLRRRTTLIALRATAAGRELNDEVERHCGPQHVERLVADVEGLLTGHEPSLGVSQAYLPDEVDRLSASVGLSGFQWALEGELLCAWPPGPALAPKYAGMFGGEPAVWEFVCERPDPDGLQPDPALHVAAGRAARTTRVFVPWGPRHVLANSSRESFPPELLAYAQASARRVGPDYLRRLAQVLVADAPDAESRAQRLIRFVQEALHRDPIAQPVLRDGSLPDPLTTLLCARGRCGHAAGLLVALCEAAGLPARVEQLPRHVYAAIEVDGRWVLGDADAFKLGVLPLDDAGRLLTVEAVRARPTLLDRYPATGWWPSARALDLGFGAEAAGYVDALEPERRGFLSSYYDPALTDAPPRIPRLEAFERTGERVILRWSGDAPGYAVRVSSASRGWTYAAPPARWAPAPAADVYTAVTPERGVEFVLPQGVTTLYASISGKCARADSEPETFYWPSEEGELQV